MDMWQEQEDESSEPETAQNEESKVVGGEAVNFEVHIQW